MRFYGKVVDRVFAIVLIALFTSLILLAGSLLVNVNDQLRQDETYLTMATRLQKQTYGAFNNGADYGYRMAYTQLIPAIRDLVQTAIKLHDQNKHTKIHKGIRYGHR